MKIKLDLEAKILAGIIALSVFLRFWSLSAWGLQSDPAVNSMRALGWFDVIAGKGQTTPFVWFKQIPWWGILSFHDHPPLAFLMQFFSFKLFGANTVAALLPFALAGVAACIILYFLMSSIQSKTAGLAAAGIFAVCSYAVFSARTGYLEGLAVLFVTASLYCFSLYIKRKQDKFLLWWGLCAGLAILTKYTAIFLLPAVLLYLLWQNRPTFKNPKFWLALVILGVVLAPVIIYNAEVFQTRGHFDASFSAMIGIHSNDFETLSGRDINHNFLPSLLWVGQGLANNISWPLLILFAVAGLLSLRGFYGKSEIDNFYVLFTSHIIFGWIVVAVAGAAERFLPILLPPLVLALALAIGQIQEYISTKPRYLKIWYAGMAVIFLIELFYSVNTNLISQPFGKSGISFGSARFYNTGFEELDGYLEKNVLHSLGPAAHWKTLSDQTRQISYKGKEVVLFDERSDWFSRTWYADRYVYYYRAPILYYGDVLSASEKNNMPFFTYLKSGGATGFWIILAQPPSRVAETDSKLDSTLADLEKKLESLPLPVKDIYNYKGQSAFKVYHLQVN